MYIFSIRAIRQFLFICVAMVASTQALAAPEKIVGIIGDEDDAVVMSWLSSVTDIRSQKILVQSSKTIKHCSEGDCINRLSDLRVAIVEVDGGPSTDVSAPAALYLTVYNSVEESGIGRAVHLIEEIFEVISSRRLKPGIYEAVYRAFRLGGDCQNPVVRATIDARKLTTKMRAAKEVELLDEYVYVDPIYVQYDVQSCE